MRVRHGLALLLAAGCLQAQTAGAPAAPNGSPQPEGVRPRGTAAVYAAQVQTNTATIAASVLSPQQVKQRFTFDISKTYAVLELAIFPEAANPAVIREGDFRIRLSNHAELVDAADPATVASAIQQKNAPARASAVKPSYTEVNAGYGRGTNPYTGKPVSSVYVGGGVGMGDPGGPNPYPRAGGYPEDRVLLEEQLWHRSLPEGTVTKPVAGYLYFPLALLKKEKGFYLVELLGETQGKTELRVPLAK